MASSPPPASALEPQNVDPGFPADVVPAPVAPAEAAPPPIGLDSELGFTRPEMYKGTLAGTVHHYERHVFLCFKEAMSWPPQVEAADFDRLPRLLAATLKERKNDMLKKTRLTICEGRDGTDSSNGDVLIFPDMVRYKGLTHFDIESFVDEVLVKEREWPSGRPEKLEGAHVFVCAHAGRDKRCGFCGPVLIQNFKNEISLRGLDGQVFVRPCSHIGGHKYAGNVIIYSPDATGEISGHWYGYVTPDDVAILLDDHIGKGTIIDKLWRGQMGLIEADPKQAQQQRLQVNGGLLEDEKKGCFCSRTHEETNGHFTGNGSIGCCQEKTDSTARMKKNKKSGKGKTEQGGGFGRSWSRVSSCFDSWERGDTFAALAVAGAVAAVVVAFRLFRNSS